MNNDIQIDAPRRKIDIGTLKALGMPTKVIIPKNFYTMEDFEKELKITPRAIRKRLHNLKNKNKLEIIKIRERNISNIPCDKTYYRIKR